MWWRHVGSFVEEGEVIKVIMNILEGAVDGGFSGAGAEDLGAGEQDCDNAEEAQRLPNCRKLPLHRPRKAHRDGRHGRNLTQRPQLIPLLRLSRFRGRRRSPASFLALSLTSRWNSLLLCLRIRRNSSPHLRSLCRNEGFGYQVGGKGCFAEVLLRGPASGVVAGVFVLWEAVRADGESEGYGGRVFEGVLGVDMVLGTEIGIYKGRATGFVVQPGVLVGKHKADALKKAFGEVKPEIGLGDRHTDIPFMALCKHHQNSAYKPPQPEATKQPKKPKWAFGKDLAEHE
ncbi:Glycerol-3-phosphate acyltransferase RAM2 [Camellia lanceoleosa]|uniref:Glycerol-3-phosphate acyltransferase RAM2 n=1 Tax=Camellia lanceoleosa TaxID=1840588 RepID=A0ACC0FWZ7_9ERIC|nr:Glycerol-3-phosphate acyltransferase RAM2 [Camellia lanceoleosa]